MPPDYLALLGGVLGTVGEPTARGRYDAARAIGALLPTPPRESDSFGAPGRRGIPCDDGRPCAGLIPQGTLLAVGSLARAEAPSVGEDGVWGFGSCGGGGRCVASELPHIVAMCRPGCIGDVTGALAREAVRRAIRSRRNEFSYCYEQEIRGRTDLVGRVETTFVIGPDGTTSGVTATSDELPAVAGCVARVLTRLRFPESEGVTGVRYPFTFELN